MKDISINLVRCGNGILVSPEENSRPHEMSFAQDYDQLAKILVKFMGEDLSVPFVAGQDKKPEPAVAEDNLWFCKSGKHPKCSSIDGTPNGHQRMDCRNCGLLKSTCEMLEKKASEPVPIAEPEPTCEAPVSENDVFAEAKKMGDEIAKESEGVIDEPVKLDESNKKLTPHQEKRGSWYCRSKKEVCHRVNTYNGSHRDNCKKCKSKKPEKES